MVPAGHNTGADAGEAQVYPAGHAAHAMAPRLESVGNRSASLELYGSANAEAFRS